MRKPKIQVQILFSLPKMKTYDEVKKEIEDLEIKNKELEKKVHDLKYGNKEKYEKEKDLAMNYLQLFGYSGVRVPMDEEMKKAIGSHIYDEINKMIKEDKDKIQDKIAIIIVRNTEYFKKTFTPVVKEIIEDLNLNVSFNL